MESARPGLHGGELAVQVRMLGPLTISRAGSVVPQPSSRKLRALIAYLALAPHALNRAHLCELLWDVPNDPRGELRWCLSKARTLLDDAGRRRIETAQDTVRLDLGDCYVDVTDIGQAMQQGIDTLDTDRLRALSALFIGDFLEGLEIDRSALFNNWLTAQRRRLRACHAAVLEHLAATLPTGSQERFACLDKWLQLAPFDRHAHELVLHALGTRAQWREGEEHLAAAVRAFEADGLDWRPLRDKWRDIRAQQATLPPGNAETSGARASLPGQSHGAGTNVCRASIAVMPFVDRSAHAGVRGGLADGLAYDIITRLAKLRSLFVIAQGTVFALDQRSVGPEEAGRTLNVDYVVSGSLRRQAKRIAVDVELVESRTARIVWADVFDHTLDDAFLALDEIGNRIVASIEIEIETAERNRAILKPPSSLDAWEAHHRGLWHMYRFNRADNEQARHFFEMAVRLDPTFSRAYAGLSFTHWQNAFQCWSEQKPAIDLAFETAGQGLIADNRDPAAHWAMGRALWLRGQPDQSMIELQSAVDLSPNFALGHYTLGFVNCQSGDAEAAIGSSDYSRHLSPFDPLLFGMLAVRAIALVRLGQHEEAADWAVKAAARPNAHVHILAIAAHCLALVGRIDEALAFVAAIHKTHPSYRVADLLAAFRLTPDAEALFRKGAKRIGIS
ncbi:transcriptional regulator [Achromobacter seleniivolatilans]|uniref:Transcriptional regulator n=1 Tax=Achromobacter seleniivolatilans TaxID=3047478 RepID=A0ABY9M5I7_9BURK|nr:transcriptional regulator [Achromobacter sp. R39]WMD22251.1 transcriptional regulator [Achromobacter sp. R39]